MNQRQIACKILLHVLQDERSLTEAFSKFLVNVEPQDRAFIKECCFGVCRWFFKLDFIVQQLLSKSLKRKDTDVGICLLLGIYQCQFMRIPEHAAVQETVETVKKLKKEWASKLVNAVLRSYLRQSESLLKQCEQVDEAHYAHPDWFIDKLKQQWPDHFDAILNANNQHPPMHCRLDILRQNRDEYCNELEPATPHPTIESAITLTPAQPFELLPGVKQSLISVQDVAAQLAAPLLDLKAGHRVLDACAAPGGKTRHILQIEPEIAECVAIDIDPERLKKVAENCQAYAKQVRLVCADAETYQDDELFDRILLDAPCSATGVIRRHPDIKLLRTEEDIAQVVKRQKSLLRAIWPLLKPGGILLYATCSILREENEFQLQAFLESHPDAKELEINADWGMPVSVGRQILPGMDNMDGFFYGRLTKL